MVKVASSEEKDVDFLEKYKALKQFVHQNNNTLPTTQQNDKLYRFIARLRAKYKANPETKFWEWRIRMLSEIGIDITSGARKSHEPSRKNIEPHWRDVLDHNRTYYMAKDRLQWEMKWFYAVMDIHKDQKGFSQQKRFSTLQEVLIKWFEVGDINPSECTRTQPSTNFRHTLSYICEFLSAFQFWPLRLAPTWRLKDDKGPPDIRPVWTSPLKYGNTVYFDSSKFNPKLFMDALETIPSWMKRCYHDNYRPKDEGIVRLITNDQKHDHYLPYAIGGTNYWRKATDEEITKTVTQSSGGQLLPMGFINLYDKIEDYRYNNKKHKCGVQDGYSYTQSASNTIPTFHGGRCIEDYPAIAKLKVEIWKHVYEWLSPLSQVCPPNGVQCLLHIADFDDDGYSIEPHNGDNRSPNTTSTDSIPINSSQIIGTSVIVVSFFHSQIIKLGTLDASTTGEKILSDHDSFSTDHCSVYVLDPNDDSIYYHTNKFENETTTTTMQHNNNNHDNKQQQNNRDRPTRIRFTLTFRWLGNRKQFFGPDNNSGLKYCQVGSQQYKFIRKQKMEQKKKTKKKKKKKGTKTTGEQDAPDNDPHQQQDQQEEEVLDMDGEQDDPAADEDHPQQDQQEEEVLYMDGEQDAPAADEDHPQQDQQEEELLDMDGEQDAPAADEDHPQQDQQEEEVLDMDGEQDAADEDHPQQDQQEEEVLDMDGEQDAPAAEDAAEDPQQDQQEEKVLGMDELNDDDLVDEDLDEYSHTNSSARGVEMDPLPPPAINNNCSLPPKQSSIGSKGRNKHPSTSKRNNASGRKSLLETTPHPPVDNNVGGWDCSCGEPNKEEFNFCGICGGKRPCEEPTHWECTSCGRGDNEQRFRFCVGCGQQK